jgi:hypothetical protein
MTAKAILYVLVFLAGSALFGLLAVWFHRCHHLRWTSAVAGLAGAPLLLGLILAAAPAIFGQWGLLPHLTGLRVGPTSRSATRCGWQLRRDSGRPRMGTKPIEQLDDPATRLDDEAALGLDPADTLHREQAEMLPCRVGEVDG